MEGFSSIKSTGAGIGAVRPGSEAVSKGRESYICDTTQGQLLLKEYKGSAERAEFLSAMLGHLGGQGLLTEQVVRTKEDAPIADRGG